MRRFCGSIFAALMGLCLSVAVLAQTNAERTKDFTFLYVSNPRVGGQKSREAQSVPFNAVIQEAKQPAFLLINGGLTASGAPEDWTLFRDTLTGLPQGFPIYALPGGSDYYQNPTGKESLFSLFYGEGKREAKGRPVRNNKLEDRLYQAFDVEGVHIVLIDAALPLAPHNRYAHLDTEQLNWLDKDLKRLKRDTPVMVFLNAPFGSEAISTRPIANEFELWAILRPYNIVAIFAPEDVSSKTKTPLLNSLNSTQIVSLPDVQKGFAHKIRVTPLRVAIDQIRIDGDSKPAEIAAFPILQRSRQSVLRAGFDDDGNPFLVRRHPIGLFEPRAVSDNPEQETGEYRIDEGSYQPLKRDARDIWRNPFRTESIPIGMHTASVRITPESKSPHYAEIIFEVERDSKEPTRRWATNLDNSIVSSPVLSGNTLYVSSTDTKLYALNTENGKKRTLLTSRGAFYASPLLYEKTLYIGSLDHTFYAVNADNGNARWQFKTDAPIYATAAHAQGIVCFGGNGKIYGVNAENGKQVWVQNVDGFFFSQAATDGEAFYLGGTSSRITALDAKTGTIRWQTPSSNVTDYDDVHLLTPIVFGGKVYSNAYKDRFEAYDARTGQRLWGIRLPTRESVPAVSGSTLYLVGNNSDGVRLYAVNGSDGTIRWQVPLKQRVVASSVKIAPDGKSLAVNGVRGTVSVHSTQDGKTLWQYELGPGNIFSTPEYDGETVYAATMANDVQGLNPPGYMPPSKTK